MLKIFFRYLIHFLRIKGVKGPGVPNVVKWTLFKFFDEVDMEDNEGIGNHIRISQ